MRIIYRYSLKLTERQEIMINGLKNTKNIREQILKVDTIRGIPSIWCLVDTEAPIKSLKIRLYGTGWPINNKEINKSNYLGSFFLYDSEIYHLFLEK